MSAGSPVLFPLAPPTVSLAFLPHVAQSKNGNTLGADDITRLSAQALNGTEQERKEAVGRLTAALKQERDERNRADALLHEAMLKTIMSPGLRREVNPPPATEGPDRAGWTAFCSWELEQTFQKYPTFRGLFARRDELQRCITADAHNILELDTRLTELSTAWQKDLQALATESPGVAGAAQLANVQYQTGIEFNQYRESALKVIGAASDKAMMEISSICIPFTDLVNLYARAILFTQHVEKMPVISDQEELLKAYQLVQDIISPLTDANSQLQKLFIDSPEDEWKAVKAKARLWRSALADTLNEGLYKLLKRGSTVEIIRLFSAYPGFEGCLKDYFQLLHDIKLWNERQKLPLQHQQKTPDSCDLLKRIESLVDKWRAVDSTQINEAIVQNMAVNPETKYASVFNAPVLHFSPDEKKKVTEQLKALQAEMGQIYRSVKSFKQSLQTLNSDLKVIVDVVPVSNPEFAELLNRMRVLERDMRNCREEFPKHKNIDRLTWQFSGSDNPLAFLTRYKQLEEAMHSIPAADFKKWQTALQKLFPEIQKLGENLSFEMRHYEQAIAKGQFSFIVRQTVAELITKPPQYQWRGPRSA